jgi:hypothetical protein
MQVHNMPRPWLVLPMIVLVVGCALSCRGSQRDTSSHDYLEQAFSELSKNPPLPLDKESQEKVQHIVSDLRKNASQKKLYAPEQTEAAKLGYRAFRAIAPLLRDPDPWVRESAIAVLFQLDRKRSTPFLLGMLLDTGKIQYWDDDVSIDYTVGHSAAGLLASAFHSAHGFDTFNTALDEIGQPQAEDRAKQRWWAYHLLYCDWRDTARGSECWLNYQALYSHIPAPDFAEHFKSEPERFKYIPVVWPLTTDYSRIASTRQSLHLDLVFENFGTESPPDGFERGTHVFRLVGPDGREIRATPKLNEIVKDAVIIPPVFTWNSYSWDIDLAAAYNISQPGRYRIYYSYLPPKSLHNSIYEQAFELSFWNGREYVNYFDFLVH